MTPLEMLAIGLKLGTEVWAAWAKTQGLTDEQFSAVYAQTQANFLARDPANLPS